MTGRGLCLTDGSCLSLLCNSSFLPCQGNAQLWAGALSDSRQLPAPAGPGTGGLEPGEVCKRQPLCSPGLARAKLWDPCGFLRSLAGRGKVREEREERQTDIHTAEREQGKIGKERDRDIEKGKGRWRRHGKRTGGRQREAQRGTAIYQEWDTKGRGRTKKQERQNRVHRPHSAICQPLIPDA